MGSSFVATPRGRCNDDRVHEESVPVGFAAGAATHPAHVPIRRQHHRVYWYARQQELQAGFASKGCATLFFTLSAADNHWDGLFDLMPPGYEDFPAGRRRALIENPCIADTYFGNRVDAFTKAFFGGVLEARSLWYRLEYQRRSSTNAHGCSWLQTDPGVVDLVSKAYARRKAAERLGRPRDSRPGRGRSAT